MPLYEYICRKCDVSFERFFPSAAQAEGPNVLECPRCGGTDVARILSSFWGSSTGEDSCGTGPTSFG